MLTQVGNLIMLPYKISSLCLKQRSILAYLVCEQFIFNYMEAFAVFQLKKIFVFIYLFVVFVEYYSNQSFKLAFIFIISLF